MTAAYDIDPPPDGDLGDRIRKARERLGMRQTDLAAAVHVGLSSIGAWERGIHTPSASALFALERALGVTLNTEPEPDLAPVAGEVERLTAAIDRLTDALERLSAGREGSRG